MQQQAQKVASMDVCLLSSFDFLQYIPCLIVLK